MENTTNYLFFLEPYTFIFYQEKEKVLYNTLNSAYLSCPESALIDQMLDNLRYPQNGYCIRLSENIINDPIVSSFIEQVRNSFSGDLIKEKPNQKKPFVFKPTVFFNYVPTKLGAQNISIFGERILQNLNDVSFFLDNNCCQGCGNCNKYYKQMLHCAVFEEDYALGLDDYVKIIKQLDVNQVERLNLLGGNWIENDLLQSLLPILAKSRLKKAFYFHYSRFSSKYIGLLQNESYELVILVHSGFDSERLSKHIHLYENRSIVWKFIVSSNQDLTAIEALNVPGYIKIEVVPYYTSDNFDFFRENVFFGLEDVLEEPISRQVLFRRSILNENFFGKLYITPLGNVYANMNYSPLGNICDTPLKELVYKELFTPSSWLKTRNSPPCVDCVNKLLCPSISDYELVVGRENLCKIV